MTVLQGWPTAAELLSELSTQPTYGSTTDRWLAEDDPSARRGQDEEPDPIAGWQLDPAGLLLVVGDGKMYVVPGSKVGVRVPPARLRNVDWRQVISANELGPLLGLPPVGAGGSRLFKAGPRLGVMLDAGRNPGRQPSAVYLDQLAARARDLGITEIRAVILIHRHSDHYNEIARVVQEHRISAQNVIIPRVYLQNQPEAAFNASMTALRRIFGQSWRPTSVNLRPARPGGEVIRGRYALAGTTFEFVALASALQSIRRQNDRASLLTRVTRQGEPGAMIVLGDLRGADVAAFQRAMGADMWREFLRDVTTTSGFSHHRGRLEARDLPGIMLLLEATLVRHGRLTAVLQTDPGQQQAARAETLEFMRRIGMEVREAHVATTTQPSGVRAGMRQATATGPAAQTHRPIPSGLTEGLARIDRLVKARRTIALWGPHLAQNNPAFNTTAELRVVDQGLAELRGAVRSAIAEAANVRVAGSRATGGGARDYSGGTHGAAFQAAIGRIPRATSAETSIGQAGFDALARLRRVPEANIPLEVALRDALVNGRFSRRAFQYVLSQLDPATRSSIFTGPRGGPRDPFTVFRRLRAEFGFLPSLSGAQGMSVAHLRGRPRAVARGVAGVLAVVEIGNIAAQATQSYRIARDTARKKGIAPFLRRIAFWRQLRGQPAAVAVDDRLMSQRYERDLDKIDKGLRDDDWDFLYIEHTPQRPALSDGEVLQVMAVLGFNVRNYDEYASLFEDSGQDAVRYRTIGVPWTQARWEVSVGRFETSGTNRVVERWEELPLLTEGMRKLTERIVHNTRTLLARLGRGESASTEELGTLQHPRGEIKYRARLRDGVTSSQVELRPRVPAQWGGSTSVRADPIRHRLTWDAGSRPVFFVWEETQSHLLVSGADFATYYRLRDLKTERYELGSTQRSMNDILRSVVGNENGAAWLPRGEVARI